jgi:hypothetical protein
MPTPFAPNATMNMDRKWPMQGQSNVANVASGLRLRPRPFINRKKDWTMQLGVKVFLGDKVSLPDLPF